MPSQSYNEQLQEYELAKNKREMKEAYKITPYQANRLAVCGLSVEILEEVYKDSTTEDDYGFDRVLKVKGVNSGALRMTLLQHLSRNHHVKSIILPTKPSM